MIVSKEKLKYFVARILSLFEKNNKELGFNDKTRIHKIFEITRKELNKEHPNLQVVENFNKEVDSFLLDNCK